MGTRPLNAVELTEVKQVFRDSLDFNRVKISENSSFTNFLGRIGAVYRHTETPVLNAATIGNTSFFPVTLVTNDPNHPDWLNNMGWLVHELTHQWQYQQVGIIYIVQAILAPTYTYAPSGEMPNDALATFTREGKRFKDFNREQQGDIMRDYYFSLKKGRETKGWDPYLMDVRSPERGRPHP